MSDPISRQTAIDEWRNDFKGYVNALDIPRDDYNGIMAYIDELPPAQPEVAKGTNVLNSDTISRQAAIDEIRKDKIDSNSLKIMDALGNGNEALTVNMTCDRHIRSLKNLPSAQPTYTDAEIQKMQDIEQAQIEKAFELGREDAKTEITEEQAIEHLQSTGWMQRHDRILTESTWDIIRCRDCIAYQEGIDIDGKPFTRCNGSIRTYGQTPPDWYCADRKRRTDEQT